MPAMGCRKLTYWNEAERPNLRNDRPLPVLKVVRSQKRLTPRSSEQNARSNNLYRYVGKEKDNESGLYNYGARYYAPWLCRFISVDPLAADYPQLTPFNYAANNPICDLDIDGMQNTQTEKAPPGRAGSSNSISQGIELKQPVVIGGSERGPPTIAIPSLSTIIAAPDASSTSGVLRNYGDAPTLVEKSKFDVFEGRIPGPSQQSRATIGPANETPLAGIMSRKYEGAHLAKESLANARALNPVGVGVAEGMLTVAQHPVEVAMVFAPEVAMWRLQRLAEVRKIAQAADATSKADDAYFGVRQASEYLKSNGVSRAKRIEYIQSFNIETIKLRQAGSMEFGLRYFDGKTAFAQGRFLFETFPASRSSLALPLNWNKMTSFTQWRIRPGATLIEGRAASQGLRLEGGQFQKFILNTKLDLIKL